MKQRALGDLRVGAIGLGGMPMSIEGRPDERAVGRDDPRRARRRRHPHRHRRRLPPARRRGRPQRGAHRAGPALVGRRLHLRARRDQGRPPAPRRRVVDAQRRPGLPQAGGQGLGQAARRRRDRALPVPPARPEGAVRRVGRCARRAARRGRHRARRHLERHGGPDRRGQRGPRRPARLGAEPVLAGVPVQPGRARALRRARHRLPALESRSAASQRRRARLAGTPRSPTWRGRTG